MENVKKSDKNNKFKTSAPTWNEKSELPNGSYSLSNIQYNCKYIIKKHETATDNPLVRICVNKVENRITFRINTGYCLA